MKTVYLAGPIDFGDSDSNLFRAKARNLLREAGFDVYDPSKAWSPGISGERDTHGSIQAVNNRALDHVTHVLALLPAGVPTIGTPMEIQRAIDMGKPVAVVGGVGSWALAGIVEQFFTTTAAVEWLDKQEPIGVHAFQVHKLVPEAMLPSRAYVGDAGWDLYCLGGETVEPGQNIDARCGIAVAVPNGYWTNIKGRSSALRTHGVIVNEGIIDAGYRGELFINVLNVSNASFTVEPGMRLGQLLIHQVPDLPMVEALELPLSQRGERGFGSSGV